MQQRGTESNQRTAQAITAATPAPPKAMIAPAPVRYADQQAQYQANKLDPQYQASAEKIYQGSSSIDQARITAESMKRAAGMQPRKPMLAAGTPSRPKFATR
jgi:hypothetical protein